MVSLRIALRYLFSKKSSNAVNVISIISIAGVAVASMAIVCVLSVFNGFSDLAYSRLSIIDPQIKVVPRSGKIIQSADSLAETLISMAEVRHATATIEDQALAMFRNRQMPIQLKGVPAHYDSITGIARTIIDGMYIQNDGINNYATLSVGTAIKLVARPEFDDVLAIYAPRRRGNINPANPMAAFRSDSLLVGGVYMVEENDHDASTVIVPMDVARHLLDYTTEASAIEVALQDGVDERTAVASISAALGPGYNVLTRLQQEEQSFKMIEIEKWITFLMLAFILVIASFNVISTLSMLIIEKSDNMVTLKALGAPQGMIRRIFIWEGWLISLVGGVSGVILGVVLCLAQQWGGFIKLSGDPSQLSITEYPVRVAPADLCVVLLLVVLTGLVISAVTSRINSANLRVR